MKSVISFVFPFFLSFLLGNVLSSSETQATDFYSARTASLGGAGRAAPLLADSVYMNPSYISFLKAYSVTATYAPFSSEGEPPSRSGRLWGLALQDGKTEAIQAGMGYVVRPTDSMIHLVGARQVFTRYSVGFGLKFLMPNEDGINGAQDINLSATALINRWLQVSIILDNMIQTETALARGLARELVIATKVNLFGVLLLYFDPHLTPGLENADVLGYELGAEISVFGDVMIRLGHYLNAQVPFESSTGRGVAFGAGWIGPRISLDYGFLRSLENDAGLPQTNSHQFSLSVFF